MPTDIGLFTIEHARQRYPTYGDWVEQGDGTVLRVYVSRTPNERMNVLLMVHELVEALLCRAEGITQREVDDFDTGPGAQSTDPGTLPHAPYHKQHGRAEIIERLMADWLKIKWDDYVRVLEALDVKEEG